MENIIENRETEKKDGKLKMLCEEFRRNNQIPPEKFDLYNVKKGLRNPDGTGVLAGLTLMCNVHGYVLDDGEKRIPDRRPACLPRRRRHRACGRVYCRKPLRL